MSNKPRLNSPDKGSKRGSLGLLSDGGLNIMRLRVDGNFVERSIGASESIFTAGFGSGIHVFCLHEEPIDCFLKLCLCFMAWLGWDLLI